jgi:hypothetical protein
MKEVYYLVTITCKTGEYEFSQKSVMKGKSITKRMHKYMMNYYGSFDDDFYDKERGVYLWLGGEVGGWYETKEIPFEHYQVLSEYLGVIE